MKEEHTFFLQQSSTTPPYIIVGEEQIILQKAVEKEYGNEFAFVDCMEESKWRGKKKTLTISRLTKLDSYTYRHSH